MKSGWAAVALGALITAGLVWTARMPEAGLSWRLAFVALHLGAALLLVMYLDRCSPTRAACLWGAVLFRVLAFPMLPTLSDDGYRYIWDGRVVVERGESPYTYRPSDPALASERATAEFRRMNSPHYHSVYPPASQAVFALAVAASGSTPWPGPWWSLKLLLLLFEGTAIVLLVRHAGAKAAAGYAWHPLSVMEVAGQAHTEALIVGLLAVALFMTARWPVRSVALSVAGAVKVYPLALLPLAWRREGWAGVIGTGCAVGIMTVPLWPADARQHVAESLGLFFGTFDAYAGPYRLLKALVYPVVGDTAGAVASRVLSIGLAFLALAAAAGDDGTRDGLRRGVTLVLVGVATAASTLHPWVLLPLLFVVPLMRHRAAVLWLIGWASATYLGYVVPGASDLVLGIGWGGMVGIWLSRRLGSDPPPAPRLPGPIRPAGSAGTR